MNIMPARVGLPPARGERNFCSLFGGPDESLPIFILPTCRFPHRHHRYLRR